MRKTIPFALGLAFLLLNIQSVYSEKNILSLQVTVVGTQPEIGQVILSLFNSKESYLKQPYRSKVLSVGKESEVSWTFKDLESGTYALSAIYDEDKNGKLNTGFLRIPKELIGMSNNAKGTFGPPSFEKASFSLVESRTLIIRLGKAKN